MFFMSSTKEDVTNEDQHCGSKANIFMLQHMDILIIDFTDRLFNNDWNILGIQLHTVKH